MVILVPGIQPQQLCNTQFCLYQAGFCKLSLSSVKNRLCCSLWGGPYR